MLQKLIIFFLFILAIALSVVATHPKWRENLRQLLQNSDRQILATVQGPLQPGGPAYKIIKLKINHQIFIEVYQNVDGGQQFTLLQQIATLSLNDAFFSFQGNATNLAFADIDNDGISEVLSPTFDEQGSPRLLVFKFDKAIGRFTLQGAPPTN